VTTPFVLSCDGAGAFDGSPDVVTGLTCSENTCNAAGGTRTGYACSGATTATACDDGTASTATTVTEFGSVTCATGYGTGPLALLAGNGPAVTCTNGGDFAFTGCHNRKCDAIDDASNDFSETNCMPNPGTKIMDPLTDIFCETTTCASTDCCTNINECIEVNDAATTGTRTDATGVQMHNCASNSYCTDADPTDSTSNGIQGTTLALNGDSAGGTSTTHTCTCNDGYFGDGDTAGTGCTTCTAVANSINVTCTSATNSRAACVTGSILVPAATTSTADVCRLECPFVDLMAMVDALNPTCPTPGAADDIETSKDACQAVNGCFYTPDPDGVGAGVHSCGKMYDACRLLGANNDTCVGTAAPRVWGAGQTVALGSTAAACGFMAAGSDAGTWDDAARCDIAPSSILAGAVTYADTRVPVVRCTALLNTGWAHDLRGSCDASRACPLHTAGAVDGLVDEVGNVFPAVGVPDLTLQSTVNGVGSGVGSEFFTSDASDLFTTFEICSQIRDAVNAAPTCSSGS